MPKYIVNEELLREWASYDKRIGLDVEAEIARHKREPDGQLSDYKPATRALKEEKLPPTARVGLVQLRILGVVQLSIRYDGGGDEDFAYLQEARTELETMELDTLVACLEGGPLGEQPETPYYYHAPNQMADVTRERWTEEALFVVVHELANQLLGEGYGTGEFSIEGAFVADLQNNTLTDIAPEGE